MSNKVDIFQLMSRLDKGDYFVYDKLTDDEKKEVSPYMMMRWMAGTDDKKQILKINAIVNTMIFNIPRHNNLHTKLLAVASTKSQKRYVWNKTKGVDKKQKLSIEVIKGYYQGYSDRDAEQALALHNKESIVEMAESLGYQKEDIQKIKKEW